MLPIERSVPGMLGASSSSPVQPVVVELHLELFVEAVEHFAVDALGACFGVIDHDRLTLELEHAAACWPKFMA